MEHQLLIPIYGLYPSSYEGPSARPHIKLHGYRYHQEFHGTNAMHQQIEAFNAAARLASSYLPIKNQLPREPWQADKEPTLTATVMWNRTTTYPWTLTAYQTAVDITFGPVTFRIPGAAAARRYAAGLAYTAQKYEAEYNEDGYPRHPKDHNTARV